MVTSMSTASQVAPRNETGPLWFAIVYIFVSIPVFGVMTGLVADVYINRYVRKQKRADLSRSVDVAGLDLVLRGVNKNVCAN